MRWAWLLGLPGCIEFGISAIQDTDPPEQLVAVHEEFVQRPLPAVDLLFVVDDTASMAQEQAALAARFAGLVGALDDAGVSWHVGVATTDMGGPLAGWLRGSPYVLTPTTPDAPERFGDLVQVGTEGAAPEAGLAAALLALELAGPGGPNAAFRRPDAVLHVVFVSDADDGSGPWLGADPAGAFLDALADEHARTGAPALASAVVGDAPSGCVSEMGMAQPGSRYLQVVEASGGEATSICAADFSPLLAAIGAVSVAWPQVFPLQAAPYQDSLRVTVDGEDAPGWELDADALAIVFDVPPPPSSRIVASYIVEIR